MTLLGVEDESKFRCGNNWQCRHRDAQSYPKSFTYWQLLPVIPSLTYSLSLLLILYVFGLEHLNVLYVLHFIRDPRTAAEVVGGMAAVVAW